MIYKLFFYFLLSQYFNLDINVLKLFQKHIISSEFETVSSKTMVIVKWFIILMVFKHLLMQHKKSFFFLLDRLAIWSSYDFLYISFMVTWKILNNIYFGFNHIYTVSCLLFSILINVLCYILRSSDCHSKEHKLYFIFFVKGDRCSFESTDSGQDRMGFMFKFPT